MPKINSITVSLNGDKQVYRPGELVSGHWTIDVGEAFSVRGVRLALKGAAYTRWNDDSRKDDKIGYECFSAQWKTVFGDKVGEQSSGTITYPAKKHEHKFSFRIPAGRVPSSYEGSYGAIRYWLSLVIDRPLFRFNITRLKTITVLDNIDVNEPQFTKFVARRIEKTVHKAIVLGDEGKVTLHAQTDRGAYCPGEKIAISLIANNGTDRDLGGLKATLTQSVSFMANGEEKTKTTPLQSVTGAPLKKQEKRNWARQALTVPAVPPSTVERTCHIVKVSYYVKVLVDIPIIHGGDASVLIPVTIGTIPQGHTSRPRGASNSFEIDASSLITHAQCTRGCYQFSKGDSRFPSTTYVPWCTYVPNFEFQATNSAKPAKVNATAKAAAKAAPHQPAKQSPTPAPEANMAAPRQVPSAPPMDLAPPSYEEVMREITGSNSEQSTTSTNEPETDGNDDAATKVTTMPPKADKAQSLLILRFPDRVMNEFRTAVSDSADIMRKTQGEALAISSQVIVSTGSWPARTSVALFVFPTKDDGKHWFSQSENIFKSRGVEFHDVFLLNTMEQFVNEKNLFNLSLLKMKPGISAARFKEYSTKAREILRPVRVDMGGIVIGVAKQREHVTGSWPNKDDILSLSQWDSLNQLWEHKSKLNQGKCKEVVQLYKELYDKPLSVTFQTEDLAFLQELVEADGEDVTINRENAEINTEGENISREVVQLDSENAKGNTDSEQNDSGAAQTDK